MNTLRRMHSTTSTHSHLPSTSASSLSSQKTEEWIREVLRKYVAKYVRDFLAERKDIVPSPVTSWIVLGSRGDGAGQEAGAGEGISPMNEAKLHPGMHTGNGVITSSPSEIIDMKLNERNAKTSPNISTLTITDETALGDDRISYLSRIISIGVEYSIGSHSDLANWLVKLPSNHFDERNLARITNVHRREVHFYSVILQDIKLWLESSDENPFLTLNVPACYYAHHQLSSDFDIDQDFDLPNPEFTLVLEDLRVQGFGKRHFGVGLSVDEAIEALREIAKFHVTALAVMRAQQTEEAVLERWPEVLLYNNLYDLYLGMIRQGFNQLRRFNRDFVYEQEISNLVNAMLQQEPKLPAILQNLLRPLSPPSVTTLVHMDLWTDNLLFREKNVKGDSANAKTTKEIDCMILDWQMVSLGRITHDLGILMMTSLDGVVRRQHDVNLLRFYYDTIQNLAAGLNLTIPLTFSELLEEYKESCLLAVLLCVGRMELVVSEPSTMQRFFEALEDLQSEGFI